MRAVGPVGARICRRVRTSSARAPRLHPGSNGPHSPPSDVDPLRAQEEVDLVHDQRPNRVLSLVNPLSQLERGERPRHDAKGAKSCEPWPSGESAICPQIGLIDACNRSVGTPHPRRAATRIRTRRVANRLGADRGETFDVKAKALFATSCATLHSAARALLRPGGSPRSRSRPIVSTKLSCQHARAERERANARRADHPLSGVRDSP